MPYRDPSPSEMRLLGFLLDKAHLNTVDFAKMNHALIRKKDGLFQHVVDRLAEKYATSAARIVAHHAANGGAAGGGDVWSKAKAQRSELGVQLIQYDARLYPDPALFGIYFEDSVVILRGIRYDALADYLAGLRRAASTHSDRAAESAADFDQADDILAVLGDYDAQRLNLINASVRRVERSRNLVEADLALNLALEFPVQAIDVHQFYVGLRNGRSQLVKTQCVDSML